MDQGDDVLPATYPPTNPPTPPSPPTPSLKSTSASSLNKEAELLDSKSSIEKKNVASTSSLERSKENGEDTVDPEATNVVSSQHKSQFLQFVSTLASFTGDISQLTCPSFLISGVSILEYCAHWCDHPQFFTSIPLIQDPLQRMMQVTKWFLSTLYGAYHSRCKDGTEKKPYNPILGELFLCSWQNESLKMTCEQVSHHPPISAFRLSDHPTNPTISLDGHCGQKSKFKTTCLKVTQQGRAFLRVYSMQDEYLITPPSLAVRGLLSGNIFVDLEQTCEIVSRSGYLTLIQFLPKPWFSGEYYRIKAQIIHMATDRVEATLSGNWTQKILFGNEVFLDHTTMTPCPPVVAPVPEQSDLESRKVWQKCTEALLARQFTVATKEKTAVEESQRALRKEREQQQQVWSPQRFQYHENAAADLVQALVAYATTHPKSIDPAKIQALGTGAWLYKET